MKHANPNNKIRLNKLELYNLALARLNECPTTSGKIIRFPDTFLKLCRSFSIDKEHAWKLLFELQKYGYVQIVRPRGVMLL